MNIYNEYGKMDCNSLSERMLSRTKELTTKLSEKYGRAPGLAVIQVGNDPASTTYVKKKKEKAESLGFFHMQINLEENTSETEVLNKIDEFAHDDSIDGILVQLPLPKHINEKNVINAIPYDKDVDGFTPENIGRLMIGETCFIPCTPKGILDILDDFDIETNGKNIVVVGRSNIVGRPIASLLSQQPWNGNVTLLHSKTRYDDMQRYLSNADIIILAVGQAGFLSKEMTLMLRSGVTIIDVGINRVPDLSKKSGFRLVGDLDTTDIREDINYTPVPGGVGIMTTTELMLNTFDSYTRRINAVYEE